MFTLINTYVVVSIFYILILFAVSIYYIQYHNFDLTDTPPTSLDFHAPKLPCVEISAVKTVLA